MSDSTRTPGASASPFPFHAADVPSLAAHFGAAVLPLLVGMDPHVALANAFVLLGVFAGSARMAVDPQALIGAFTVSFDHAFAIRDTLRPFRTSGFSEASRVETPLDPPIVTPAWLGPGSIVEYRGSSDAFRDAGFGPIGTILPRPVHVPFGTHLVDFGASHQGRFVYGLCPAYDLAPCSVTSLDVPDPYRVGAPVALADYARLLTIYPSLAMVTGEVVRRFDDGAVVAFDSPEVSAEVVITDLIPAASLAGSSTPGPFSIVT